MSWSDAHRQAIVAAAATRESLELDGHGRIDVFEALVAQGVKLMFRPLDGLAGFYEPSRDGARPGVLINSRHPLALQRFSAGHEFGHHVFEHGRQVDTETEPTTMRSGGTQEERLAEAFASWFLMPPEAARSALARMGLDRLESPSQAYGLALRLGVSYLAMCTHAPSLSLATTKTTAAWGKHAPKSIKEELTAVPPPGGWANDVWVLYARDTQAQVVVRGGDRILFGEPASLVSKTPNGLVAYQQAPNDLLSHHQLCVDVTPGAPPGPCVLDVSVADTVRRFVLTVEQPLRGRYLPRRAASQ